MKALWLCTGKSENEKWEDTPESAGDILREHIVTVKDFAEQLRERNIQEQSADALMVDWNAMPLQDGQRGRGSLDGLSSVVFQVLGCIDHHVDENFLPSPEFLPSGQPLVVTQAGSCTSLVVNTLREKGIWHEGDKSDTEETQIAQLALASILIDTANLTSKDKTTIHDADAFAFLSPRIHNDLNTIHTVTTPFYERIHKTKQNSLDLLTVDEILVRDYKQWEEKPRGESVKLGFCSTVRSLSWIIRKAGDSQKLLDSLRALCDRADLDVVVVMTAFTSPTRDNQFCRELLVCAAEGDKQNGIIREALNSFVSKANSQLGLADWYPMEDGVSEKLSQDIKSTLNQGGSWRRVWVQTDLSMSRKQVAPLLRVAIATQ